jgi:nitrate reductase gamma subunit
VACVVFLFVRRLARPEVRILSSLWDYVLLLLTAAPFVTGYLAYHQYNDYTTWLVLHILCSEILMIIVPFSKLGHLILFFFTRAFIGSDMGGRRDQYGRLGARTW